MKVYGVFKEMMLMPYLVEVLVKLCTEKEDANAQAYHLNQNNTDPMEEDDYGPLSGTRYLVKELEIE